jgi:hypothetical protein
MRTEIVNANVEIFDLISGRGKNWRERAKVLKNGHVGA